MLRVFIYQFFIFFFVVVCSCVASQLLEKSGNIAKIQGQAKSKSKALETAKREAKNIFSEYKIKDENCKKERDPYSEAIFWTCNLEIVDAQGNVEEEAKLVKPREAPQPKSKKSNCKCLKSVKRLEETTKLSKKQGLSISKAYRKNSNLFISPQTIIEALNCTCARSALSKDLVVNMPSKEVPLNKKAEHILILAPGEVPKNCKKILALSYNFTKPIKFRTAINSYSNLAADLKGNAVVIYQFHKRKGTKARIFRCPQTAQTDEKIFADTSFKEFSNYVFDPQTGLSWQYCSYGQTLNEGKCIGEPRRLSLTEAKNYCASLYTIRQKKWRLPEAEELLSLVRKQKIKEGAKINQKVFSSTPAEVYWSYTHYWDKRGQMTVDFESGNMIAYSKKLRGYVRCVIDLIPYNRLN